MGGRRGELEKVVCFAAHDDEGLLLGRSQLGCVGECIKEAVQAGIVFIGCRVACGGDNADLDVLAEKVCEIWLVWENCHDRGWRNMPISRGMMGLVGSRLSPSS